MLSFDDITAVILAGGKSTRMGRDKALIPVAGRPLVSHTLEGLSRLFPRVLLSANRPADYAFLGLPIVTDLEPQWGALAGIHAGLLAAPTPWIFALAVDMPLVDPAVVRLVIERATPDAVAVIPHGLDYHQPLHALYGPKARDILAARAGQPYHIHDLASHSEVVHIAEDEVKRVSPELRCFLNANTPEELQVIEQIFRGR